MNKVHHLTPSDFDFNRLRSPHCTLVLFYNDLHKEDQNLATIWQIASRSGSITNFASVNLRIYPDLNFLFPNSPIIVSYQNHLPEVFYHDKPYQLQDIIDYALTLACNNEEVSREQELLKYATNYL